MIVVTGGAGFIGSNLVAALNRRGREDILVVDDLTDGTRFANLVTCRFLHYLDKDEFRALVRSGGPELHGVQAVLHQGACTDTMEWNGRYLMDNNYRYSMEVLDFCTRRRIPLIYASSAAVYGTGERFAEMPGNERPVNPYGFSKLVFDQHVRRNASSFPAPVIGLRYFNVYGPGEAHKGTMASVIHHFNRQIIEAGRMRLFRGTGGYADGEQKRDFVHVDDIVAVNLWFLDHGTRAGIFNVGTGRARSFNDVASAVAAWHGRDPKDCIEYVDFPAKLVGRYQHFTQADLAALRAAGYDAAFTPLEEGVRRCLDTLNGAGSG